MFTAIKNLFGKLGQKKDQESVMPFPNGEGALVPVPKAEAKKPATKKPAVKAKAVRKPRAPKAQ